jgi:hypothetical protein
MDQNNKILYLLNFDKSKTLSENRQIFLNEQKNVADIKTYPACVASETSNKNRAELKKTNSGQYFIKVYVKNMSDYQFYNNNRVKKPDGTMGNYSCRGNDILIDGIDISSQEWNKVKNNYVTDYEKSQLDKSTQISGMLDKLDNLDPHDVLMYTSMAAYFFGPWGVAISLGLDLGNAYLYHKEGRDFEAGLQVAFSIIPGGDLIGKIPIVRKYGIKWFEKMLLKSTKGGVMTKVEREAWDELMKSSKLIKSEVTKQILKRSFTQIFKNFRLPDIIQFMWLLQKNHPNWYFLGKLGIQIGGIYYTWSKLARIFGISDKKYEDVNQKNKIEADYNKNPGKSQEKAVEDITNGMFSVPTEKRDSMLLELQQEVINQNQNQ